MLKTDGIKAKSGKELKARLALLVLVGVFGLTCAHFALKESPPEVPKEWTRLRPGMTRAEVLAVTSAPVFHVYLGYELTRKDFDQGYVQLGVTYDEAGFSRHAQVTFMTHKSAVYQGPDSLF
ncbi:MAG TPA: hypothetical protein VGH19_23980 [Verrucomicrobiae bacterium]